MRVTPVLALFAFFAMLLVACSSPQVAPGPDAVERTWRERAMSVELRSQLERQIRLASDPALSAYLKSVALKLSSPNSSAAELRVLVMKDRDGLWRNLSLPKSHIYLSAGLLRNVEFENELAASIAIELAHLAQSHVARRLYEISNASTASSPPTTQDRAPAPGSIDFFSSERGIFRFTDQEQLDAAVRAVYLLYDAGYDPRGLVSLWEDYGNDSERSPYSEELLQKLLDKTRETIARRAPLRNPVVRTKEFLSARKRMRRL